MNLFDSAANEVNEFYMKVEVPMSSAESLLSTMQNTLETLKSTHQEIIKSRDTIFLHSKFIKSIKLELTKTISLKQLKKPEDTNMLYIIGIAESPEAGHVFLADMFHGKILSLDIGTQRLEEVLQIIYLISLYSKYSNKKYFNIEF